jgi:RimJ/RimL family protein N-acetyltransferase
MLANDYHIWRNLADGFPFPYTLHNAQTWIALHQEISPCESMAITLNGKLVGAVGMTRCPDEAGVEVGYWVGQLYWNRGIATRALSIFLTYMAKKFPHIQDIKARVVIYNPSSARVLEKNGFVWVETQPQAFLKEGKYWDLNMYVYRRRSPS